ncbi:MAG: DHH family phosphoesterase [Paludibacteraceae bacterium]|nr:DHH family phosphoesterase [Paludibacteraceae bacterium]
MSELNQHDISCAKQLIDNANRIVITTHLSPDGDAMGSSHALKHILYKLGKKDIAIITPNDYPSFLAWLPEAEQVLIYDKQKTEADEALNLADLIICADYNATKRIGDVANSMLAAKAKKLLIDHHVGPEDFPDVVLSYPQMPSCCELIYHLINDMGYGNLIDKTIATCIYTGMMTDTVNFSVNFNNPDTYLILAELLRHGIDRNQIYSNVYNQFTVERTRLVGYCLYKKMIIIPEYRTAVIALNRKELFPFNFMSGDAEGIVNIPLQIADVDMSVFMREDKDKIKISFRSKGDLATNIFANKYFNGGGHKNASGGESYDSVEATIKRLIDHLPDLKNCQ